jgi:hypothetical protein
MSTYSTTLRIELIGAGEQDGTWGDTTNSNLGDLIEAAITNKVDITFANAQYTLSANNGLPDEARNAVLNLVGTNSGPQNLIAPSVEKTYIVVNDTGATVTIKTSGGTGVAVPNGTTRIVWCDGTDFFTAASPTNAGTGLTFSGDTLSLANTAVTAGTYAAATVTVDAQGRLTSASATTLGTMATQNANAVAVTGGTINGAIIGGSNAVAATFTTATATTVALGSGWTATVSGGKLIFQVSGVTKASLDSSGNFIVTGNVTAYGTP